MLSLTKAVIRVIFIAFATIFMISGCESGLSRHEAEEIIKKSPASFKKKVHLNVNGLESGIQHDLWLKKRAFIGYETKLTERGTRLIEDISGNFFTLKKPLEIEVDVSGIADAVLPLTSTKGIKEAQFTWNYLNISTPIKWVIAEGGNGKAYFRLYDDGWRLEGFDDIEYNDTSIHLSGNEVKEEQSDRENIAKKREEIRRAKAEKKRKEEEMRRKEQAKLAQSIRKSKTPSKTIGSFKCINITVGMGKRLQANGEAILTDVDASYMHVYTDYRGNIKNKKKVNFWFGNIKSIYKQDSSTYRTSFKLKNTIVIRPGDHAYAIWFQDKQTRDNFYTKIVEAKAAWDKKYPELK